MPVMIPGQRQRQHQQQRDRLAAEEPEPVHAERGGRAEQQRDGGGEQARLQRQQQRRAHLRVVPGDREPLCRQPWMGQLWTFDLLNA